MQYNFDLALPHVRCPTCGKVIGHLYTRLVELLQEGSLGPADVLDQLGVTRYCCRMNLLRPPLLPAGMVIGSGDLEEAEVRMRRLRMGDLEPAPQVSSGIRRVPGVYDYRARPPMDRM